MKKDKFRGGELLPLYFRAHGCCTSSENHLQKISHAPRTLIHTHTQYSNHYSDFNNLKLKFSVPCDHINSKKKKKKKKKKLMIQISKNPHTHTHYTVVLGPFKTEPASFEKNPVIPDSALGVGSVTSGMASLYASMNSSLTSLSLCVLSPTALETALHRKERHFKCDYCDT